MPKPLRVITYGIVVLSLLAACRHRQESNSPVAEVIMSATMCDLARDEDNYDGKIVRVRATMATCRTKPYVPPAIAGPCLVATDSDGLCDYNMTFMQIGNDVVLSPDLKKILDISREEIVSKQGAEADVIVTCRFDSHYKVERLIFFQGLIELTLQILSAAP